MDKPNLTGRISVPRKQATSAQWRPRLQENYKMVVQGREKEECKPPKLTCWSETQYAKYIKKKRAKTNGMQKED